jgi:hypothetical protein
MARTWLVAAFTALVLTVAADAFAQGVGFAGGVAFDPTQGFVGAQFESPPFVDRLHFRAGIDGAFGNGVSEALIDILFLYKFDVGPLSPWSVYQGTGPVIVLQKFTNLAGNNDVSAHGGFSGVFGVAHRDGFFFEFKVSGGGGPSLRLGVGYMIRSKQP